MNKNRIDEVFSRCRDEGRAALILYITSGFPNEETTRKILPVLAEHGCDLIELGIPFSDPIADGPTIQKASTVALENGMTLEKSLKLLSDFRITHNTPVILFGALNPFLRRGLVESTRDAAAAGADGILAADLPVEEADELKNLCLENGLHLISLIAPTSGRERMLHIAQESSGFLYCIAVRGVTGARKESNENVTEYLESIRKSTNLPLALGFGISTPEHVRAAVDAGADGVVIGSALINLIEERTREGKDPSVAVADFISSMTAELRHQE